MDLSPEAQAALSWFFSDTPDGMTAAAAKAHIRSTWGDAVADEIESLAIRIRRDMGSE